MQIKPRSILVAGRTGQLARTLITGAIEYDLSVMALERPDFDLCVPKSVDQIVAAVKPRAIINAAAYTLVDKAESEADLAFTINRDGAAHLARIARLLRVPFIHISTDYVFDGKKSTPYREDDPTSPLGIYGQSKLAGEIEVLNSNPAAVILRTSWIYSPYGQNFVKTMLHLAETRDCVRVVNDQYGVPTSARDLAQAVFEILLQVEDRAGDNLGGIYHLTASGQTTWYEFAAAIFAGWAQRGRSVPTLEPLATADYPTAARRPANSRLDCSKAARVFGVRLPLWQDSLGRCLDELVVNQTSNQPC